MSNEAITWAYRQDITNGAKFVLVALADMADEAHSCYPGQAKLAQMTGQSERTVRRQLAELEIAGYITRARRFDKAGHRTSDRYKLPVDADVLAIPTGQNDQSYGQPANSTTGRNDRRSDSTVPTGQRDRVSLRGTQRSPQPPAEAGGAGAPNDERGHCTKHAKFRNRCDACSTAAKREQAKRSTAKEAAAAALAECGRCDPDGWVLADDGAPTASKCRDHRRAS
jgi:ribosomal protein L44E